jgi:hypothetical protein
MTDILVVTVNNVAGARISRVIGPVYPKFGSLKLANRGKSDGNWCNGNDKWGNFGSPDG